MIRQFYASRRAAISFAATVSLGVAIVIGVVMIRSTEKAVYIGPVSEQNRVVATVQASGKSYSQSLRTLLRSARANPNDMALATAAARGLIAEGREAGDSRLVGASLGLLRPFMDNPTVETLYLAATARQYQHDFKGALTLLDQAIAKDPRDPNALLTRATIYIVLGQYDRATPDCKTIAALPYDQLAFLCQATALILTTQAPMIYKRLEAITSMAGMIDPDLRGWAVGLMGEIAMVEGKYDLARKHFAEVIAADPLAIRERLLLVDVLLDESMGKEALELLSVAPDTDGVLVRRVLAAEMLGDNGVAGPAKAELAKRFKLNLDLGLTAHAREETRYFLKIANDPQTALARAQVNWALQHEIEDAQLLIDASVAAGTPAAAAPVLVWMKEQSVVVPTLRIPAAVNEVAE